MKNITPKTLEQVLNILSELSPHFAGRARFYELNKSFPKENFDDLHRAGLLCPAASVSFGGLGFGSHLQKSFALWAMTKSIAKADMAMARCWEGHINAQIILELAATNSQKKLWFNDIQEKGTLWGCWSGEPLQVTPFEGSPVGTLVKETQDGFILNGSKVFCSGASGADMAILFVNTLGMGGARHSSSPQSVIMLACKMADKSIQLDDAWWQPIGMTASVSFKVLFNNTFIPKSNLIGYSGQFMKEEMATYLLPHYASNLLGGMEAISEQVILYIKKQEKSKDPYVQQHIGRIELNLQTCLIWLQHVANLWDLQHIQEAKMAGAAFRYQVEKLGFQNLLAALDICGSRSLIRPSPIEKIYRDFSFYAKHDNADHLLAHFGKSILGEVSDLAFASK